MKAIGMILLVLGIVGLLLNLILWLPAKFNLIIVALISVVCLVTIWGGGNLSQTKTELVKETVKQPGPAAQQSQWVEPKITCPKCGCKIMPGQNFCGGCGSSLTSYCAACGTTVTSPTKFCGNCGARLG
jgi:hypothetical protein